MTAEDTQGLVQPMGEILLSEVTERYEDTYRKRTPKSLEAFQTAKRYLPGGDTRTAIFFQPYPIWIEKAQGCQITDVDGNEYLDFHNCYTTLVLGHANPRMMEAVRAQLLKGTAHGALMPIVIRWAELICQRVESVEKIRFSNSGTEAVMMAIRVARGFTGKDKIIKMEGGYSGSYDPVVYPSDATGLPKSVLAESITIPYNNNEAAERAIVENKDHLAAVIVEGMMGSAGQIPPKDAYLSFLREVTAANNVLLILDEVQCFRIDYGGMQRIFGIKPDLTVFGKLIGGGFPVGATGGREDIMNLFSPKVQKVKHSGTLNANPITATAGVATLEQLTAEEISRINGLGESLARGIREVFAKLNIKGQITGRGSLQNLHFCPVLVEDGKTAKAVANQDILPLLHLALLERGIFMASRGLFAISTPMTGKEIDLAIKAVEDALSELRPNIEQIWPELIGTPV